VPRPDTETLVEYALELLREAASRIARCVSPISAPAPVAILLALLSNFQARTASAPTSARMPSTPRAAMLSVSDWPAAPHSSNAICIGVVGPFDLIVSNPPYIPSATIAGLAPEVRDQIRMPRSTAARTGSMPTAP